ncbi:TolC family protein [Roseivirga sp.]|uniref:TolC family protein n=1 Tax=Roseivirga sp. TaxID=1964215 RepID=UPI003B8AAAD4
MKVFTNQIKHERPDAYSVIQMKNERFNKGFFIAMLLALLLLSQAGQAQSANTDIALDNIKPLEELLTIAEGNMAAIDRLSTSQAKVSEEINVTKKKWLRHLALTAGVNYGNGIISDQLTDGGTDNRFTYLSRQNVTYNVGLNLRLPFSEVSSRKHEIKIQKLEIKRLEGMKQEQRDFIRQEVVRFYKELKSCLKAVELQTEVVEANEVALKIAENFFKAGKTPMEQYRMAVDARFTSKLEYEKSKNEAWYCMKILTELVGQSILK